MKEAVILIKMFWIVVVLPGLAMTVLAIFVVHKDRNRLISSGKNGILMDLAIQRIDSQWFRLFKHLILSVGAWMAAVFAEKSEGYQQIEFVFLAALIAFVGGLMTVSSISELAVHRRISRYTELLSERGRDEPKQP